MEKDSKIFVAGHSGMVGSAICRKLEQKGFHHFVLRTSSELDLRDQSDVKHFFETERPDYVFLAAAKVGGIHVNNTYRADFIHENLIIETNVIHHSFLCGVKKLLFLGSSCIYPKFASQPMKEDALLTGLLEATNEPYAIAKIAGIKLCQAYRQQFGCNFISLMPTNLYGPNDNYDLFDSHVLAALVRKFHSAKEMRLPSVEIWGSGNPKREFLHVDDLADACLFLMEEYNSKEIINVGTGTDLSIKELAIMIKRTIGYMGDLNFNSDQPDGTPRKLLDTSKINKLGWVAKIQLQEGVKSICEDFELAVHA